MKKLKSNRDIKKFMLFKYLESEKDLLNFLKRDKKIFNKLIKITDFEVYINVSEVDFYISNETYFNLYENIIDIIYNSNLKDNKKDKFFDCLSNLSENVYIYIYLLN